MLLDTEPLVDYAAEIAVVDASLREVLARAAQRRRSQLAVDQIVPRLVVDRLLERRSALMIFAAAAPTTNLPRLLPA